MTLEFLICVAALVLSAAVATPLIIQTRRQISGWPTRSRRLVGNLVLVIALYTPYGVIFSYV